VNGPQLGRAAGALGLAAASALVSVGTRAGGPGGYLVVVAVLSVVGFATALVGRWPGVLGVAVAGLGATHVFGHLRTDDAPELIAVAAILVVAFELGGWSMELVTPIADEPGVHRGRWVWVLGWGAAGAAMAALVLLATSVRLGGRFPLDLLAVLAALLVVGATAVAAAGFPGHEAADERADVPESSVGSGG
jgi:hypothetical protein